MSLCRRVETAHAQIEHRQLAVDVVAQRLVHDLAANRADSVGTDVEMAQGGCGAAAERSGDHRNPLSDKRAVDLLAIRIGPRAADAVVGE